MMSEGKRALQALSLPDGIYLIGGYNGKEYLNTVERLDLNDFLFYKLPDMLVSRGTFSAICSSDYRYVYCIGGVNG